MSTKERFDTAMTLLERGRISDRNRAIWYDLNIGDMTPKAVAEKYGISDGRVHQIAWHTLTAWTRAVEDAAGEIDSPALFYDDITRGLRAFPFVMRSQPLVEHIITTVARHAYGRGERARRDQAAARWERRRQDRR